MLTALLSFLGGNAFRMIFGEIISAWNKKQDHTQELQRMELQASLDAKTHERNLEAIRVQANLGIETIRVQAEADVGGLEAQGWVETIKATTVQTGVAFIDGWNATIRPLVASWAIVMITLNEFKVVTLSENALVISGAALGIYLADRTLFKRGK